VWRSLGIGCRRLIANALVDSLADSLLDSLRDSRRMHVDLPRCGPPARVDAGGPGTVHDGIDPIEGGQ
jgi:hypothetical protein